MVIVEIASGAGGFSGFDSPWDAFRTIVLGAAWLPPYEGLLHWLIPTATLVLLVPYFFVSLAIERWMLLRRWPDVPRVHIVLAAWLGNVVTYCGLAAWALYHLQHARGR